MIRNTLQTFLLVTVLLSCNENYHITENVDTNNTNENFSPLDIGGVDVWLDSKKSNSLFQNNNCTLPVTLDGDPVGCWLDQSGNVRHAIQDPAITVKPSYNTTSEMLDFVNSDVGANVLDMGFELPAIYNLPETKTFAVVINPGVTGANAGSELLGIGGGQLIDFGSFTGTDRIRVRNGASVFGAGWLYSQLTLGIIECSAADTDVYFFSNQILNSPTGSCSWQGQLNIGHSGFTLRGFIGSIAEIIIFNKILTMNEREKIEGYLACKWSLQGDLPVTHPYNVNCPSVTF